MLGSERHDHLCTDSAGAEGIVEKGTAGDEAPGFGPKKLKLIRLVGAVGGTKASPLPTGCSETSDGPQFRARRARQAVEGEFCGTIRPVGQEGVP